MGESLTLSTHFVVREDAQLLFGFCDVAERELFRTFVKINGVGPKLALLFLRLILRRCRLRWKIMISVLTKVPVSVRK